jgi:hypothetical protein
MIDIPNYIHVRHLVKILAALRKEENECYEDEDWAKLEGLESGSMLVKEALKACNTNLPDINIYKAVSEFENYKIDTDGINFELDYTEREILREAFEWFIKEKAIATEAITGSLNLDKLVTEHEEFKVEDYKMGFYFDDDTKVYIKEAFEWFINKKLNGTYTLRFSPSSRTPITC